MDRKLALLIVEGGSDAVALTVPLRNFLRNSQASCVFECVIYQTDITLHNYRNPDTIEESYDVMERVIEAAKEYIQSDENSNKYRLSDIGLIMTLSDLDACYCKESDLVFSGTDCKTFVDVVNSVIKCNDVVFMKNRNNIKIDSFGIMSTTPFVIINNKQIPYRSFYFSVNLEHALYNDITIVDADDKMKAARKWASRFKNNHVAFYESVKSIPRLADTYDDSWAENALRKNPFGRFSNLLLMIDWIVEQSKQVSDDDEDSNDESKKE